MLADIVRSCSFEYRAAEGCTVFGDPLPSLPVAYTCTVYTVS